MQPQTISNRRQGGPDYLNSPEYLGRKLAYLIEKKMDWDDDHETRSSSYFFKRMALLYFFPLVGMIYIAATLNPYSGQVSRGYKAYRRSLGKPVLSERIADKLAAFLGAKGETCRPQTTPPRPAPAHRAAPSAAPLPA